MMNESKQDCKYWDKCYQKNEVHLNKYNHPPKVDAMETSKNEELTLNEKSEPIRLKKELHKKRSRSKSPTESNDRRDRSRSPVQKCGDNSSNEQNKESVSSENVSQIADVNEADKKTEPLRTNHEEKLYFKIFHNSVHNSKKDEYIELLKTTDFIRHKFLVEMPDEFYTFWAFCVTLAKKDQKPEEVFLNLGLQLVGPFEYLAGSFNSAEIKEPGDYLRHWRFYYDPPEFQTIFVKSKTGVHYGYWRDDPSDKQKLLIARNDVNKGCVFEFVAANCFQAILYFMEKDVTATPFNKTDVKKVQDCVKKFSSEHGINLDNFKDLSKERDKKVVAKMFHKAGLVIPYDRKTQLGYRPLIESDNNLKKILNKLADANGNKEVVGSAMEQLQPMITAANIAVDECDFGTTVELGIDLFCSGYKELHELIVSLLVPGYSMLKRPQFIAIIKAHLEFRQKGNSLSLFDSE